jgi:hypothetical protein
MTLAAITAGCSSTAPPSSAPTTSPTTSPSPPSSTPASSSTSTSTSTSTVAQPAVAAVPVGTTDHPIWIVGSFQIPLFERAGLSSALVDYFFNTPQTLLIMTAESSAASRQLPAATRVERFTSYATMLQAFDTGSVLPGVKGILYDNENWALTPENEKAAPVQYAAQAEALAHQHGMFLVFSPAVNLARLAAGQTGSKWTDFLTQGLAASGARVTDVLDIQAQQAQGTVEFTTFAQQAVAQARAANPSARIVVGIGPDPGGRYIPASDVLAAYQAARPLVDGYWLNLPDGGKQCNGCGAPEPAVSVGFLQSLAASQGVSG